MYSKIFFKTSCTKIYYCVIYLTRDCCFVNTCIFSLHSKLINQLLNCVKKDFNYMYQINNYNHVLIILRLRGIEVQFLLEYFNNFQVY